MEERLKNYVIIELKRSMKLAAEREEYDSAADMKRIKEGIEHFIKDCDRVLKNE